MNVIVIGGGPAGMLAAISAKKSGNNVTIVEKMNTLRKKTFDYRKRKMQYYEQCSYERVSR